MLQKHKSPNKIDFILLYNYSWFQSEWNVNPVILDLVLQPTSDSTADIYRKDDFALVSLTMT